MRTNVYPTRLAVLVLWFGLASLVIAQQPKAQNKGPQIPPGVKVERDLEYGRVGERKLLLDLYLPENAKGPLPLIVWIHGGGWAAGSKERVGAARQLQRGYAVASVGYRVSGEAIFPAQIQDCKAAVRWLRANAKQYNLDAEHFGAWGSSAGGHLVALLGTSGDVKEFDVGDHLDQSSRVQAVCDYFGPTDLLQMDAHAPPGATLKHDAPQSPEARLIGGPIQENKDKAGRVNPIPYITPDDPPFLIVHGDQDPTVPHHQSELLYDALRQSQRRVRFHTVEGGGHGVGFGGPDLDGAVNSFFDLHLKGIGDPAPDRIVRTRSTATAAQPPANAQAAQNAKGAQNGGAPNIPFRAILAREDANRDGRVSREEFLGPPPLFNRWDRNRDGVLTQEDFADAAPAANAANLADRAAASEQPTGLLFFASYPERDNVAAATNPHIVGALHTIYWSSVEPNEGQFDWADIDQRIGRWTAAGKKVALRIMWSSSGNWPEPAAKHPTPQWVLDKGAVTAHSDSSKTDIPLIWDPVYRQHAAKFLREVARKFDGDPNILFIDVTPGAETNPYRFRRINVQEPEFKTRFAETPASDGRKYSHELWLEAVKQAVDDATAAFKKTRLLVTLNVGSLDGPNQMQAIGDHCVSRGCYVGQNGLRGNNYAKEGERASPFLAWGKQTRLYFEMLDATSAGTTGPLIDVMKRAEDIGCDYLGVYSADVLKGTLGQASYDTEYERALRYGATALGRQPKATGPPATVAGQQAPSAQPPAGFQLDGERWTYKDDSLSMHGILLKPEGKGPFPAVLISHGLGGSAQAFGMSKAREMVKWGLVCIACDYAHAPQPGQKLNPQGPERTKYGASEENMRRASKCLDLLCAMPEVNAKKLCAYGHSMGGFATIGLAAKEPDRLVAAAISGSGIAPRDGFPAPSAERATKVKTPFIIFHGSIDNTVRPAQSLEFKEILDRNKVPNERHVFEGINHPVDRDKADEVYRLMRNWFAKYGIVKDGPVSARETTEPTAPRDARGQVPAPQTGAVAGAQKAGNAPKAANREPTWLMPPIEGPNLHYKTFDSKAAGEKVSYLIYLPPEYETAKDKRYPAVYWLHGIGGAQTGVPVMAERLTKAITENKTPPMIVVYVNGMIRSGYVDSADGQIPVETVTIKELIPHIDATYRTIASREGRMIEGFSMGGGGAAKWGFKHPDVFGSISIIDGAMFSPDASGKEAEKLKTIDEGDRERLAANDPWKLAEKNVDKLKGHTKIRIVTGTTGLSGSNKRFHEHLEQLGLANEFTMIPDVPHSPNPFYDALGERNWPFYRIAFEATQAAK